MHNYRAVALVLLSVHFKRLCGLPYEGFLLLLKVVLTGQKMDCQIENKVEHQMNQVLDNFFNCWHNMWQNRHNMQKLL